MAPGTEIIAEIEFVHEPEGRVRGRESVRYRFLRNGSLSVTMHSASYDPDVIRDASYLLQSDFTPRECYVKVETDGRFAGSGWYHIREEAVDLSGRGSDGAHLTKSFPISSPVVALVSHPVSSDVMVGVAASRCQRSPGARTRGIYLTSADPYGRTMPEWTEPDVAVDFLGVEPFETPAGSLDADHFLLHLKTGENGYSPFQDLWCLSGTPIFLGAFARSPTSTRYVLRTLEVRRPD
jgi:hypothetical protein